MLIFAMVGTRPLVWNGKPENCLSSTVSLQVMLMTCFLTLWRMQDGASLKKLP